MSDRPTPEEIVESWDYSSNGGLIADLTNHGYVIAHPDDVPTKDTSDDPYDFRAQGWDECRAHIFGGDDE